MSLGNEEKNINVPKWLSDCKEAITSSTEWKQYILTLNDAIRQQLEDSHVPFFTDLSQTSRIHFVDTAMRATENGTDYRSIHDKVTSLVNHHLHTSAISHSHRPYTKSQGIIQQTYEGIEYLLHRWPFLRSKLTIFFNCPLPKHLRHLIWKTFLADAKASHMFLAQCKDDPDKRKLFNREISENCRKFIKRINLQGLNGSEGAFYCMKSILAFYLSVAEQPVSLDPKEYFITVPFLLVAMQHIQITNPVPDKVLSLLIEEYCSFMKNLPMFVQDSDKDLKSFTKNVIQTLRQKYPNAEQVFAQKCGGVHQEAAITSDNDREFIQKMSVLLKPIIQNMFVVYFNLETLLYVWDQYIITADNTSFQNSWLIAVTAISLNCLKDSLRNTTSADINLILLENWPMITVLDLQFEVKNKFNEEFESLLDVSQQRKMTFLDPSLNNTFWQKWYNSPSLEYTQPQDRRLFKEILHAEKERINQQLERNQLEIQREKLQYKQQLEELLEQSRNEKQLMLREQNSLQEKLNKEIADHKICSQNAAMKIAELSAELQTLREQSLKFPDSPRVHPQNTNPSSARTC
ncbi:uncharacterized protein LOC106881161 isoform X2 [Octopus bimaculoides]|uniref:Uncharacterized protein n=1 Tax=Octopus bimaculoides TaxID=37653 RepID=A0A0L8FU00_OCTBM|nr:uncharacterized protein LOC106881161 isoform X2 [Octopus bimaculoides]